MKVFKKYFRAFILGFTFAFFLQFFTMCPSDNITNPQTEKPLIESDQIKTFSNQVITAFQSGNKQKVIDLMYEESKEIYSKEISGANGNMSDFAQALENRKLKAANELFAEYEIEIKSKIYIISYANSGDGVWKIYRF